MSAVAKSLMERASDQVTIEADLPRVSITDAKRQDLSREEADFFLSRVTTLTDAIKKREGDALWRTALMAHGLQESGLIGTSSEHVWRSQNAYVMAAGFEESHASKVVTLARAAVLGVGPKSTEAKVIGDVSQSRGKYAGTKEQRAAVKKALKEGNADALVEAISAIRTPVDAPAVTDGSTPDGTPETPETRSPGGSTDQTETPDAPRPVRPLFSDFAHAMHGLEAMVDGMDQENFAQVEDFLNGWLAKRIDKRVTIVTGEVTASETDSQES